MFHTTETRDESAEIECIVIDWSRVSLPPYTASTPANPLPPLLPTEARPT
ncbi:hypothetical protein ACPPVQ_05825 [Diaminobutyricibacter sp. McL0618]